MGGTPPNTILGTDTVRDALKTKIKGNFDDSYDKLDPADAIGSYADLGLRLDGMQTAIENAGTGTALVMSGTVAERAALSSPTDGLIFVETDTGKTYRWDETGAAWHETVDGTHDITIAGTKTFSSAIVASGGVTGDITGNVTGNVTGTLTDNAATASRAAMFNAGKSLTSAFLGRNYIDGLIMSNDAGDTEHDISVAAGSCFDAGNNHVLDNSGAFVKRIDANWEAGTGNGGFPSGLSLSNDTWYYFFLIAKTDGTVDFGLDTDSAATNLLADATGYTLYRRIGFVLTDGSSNIVQFFQHGDYFYWKVPLHVADTAPTASDAGESYTVGPPIETIALISMNTNITNDMGNFLYARSPNATDDSPGPLIVPGYTVGGRVNTDATEAQIIFGGFSMIPTNSSGEIKGSVDDANSDIYFDILGYLDFRGKQ